MPHYDQRCDQPPPKITGQPPSIFCAPPSILAALSRREKFGRNNLTWVPLKLMILIPALADRVRSPSECADSSSTRETQHQQHQTTDALDPQITRMGQPQNDWDASQLAASPQDADINPHLSTGKASPDANSAAGLSQDVPQLAAAVPTSISEPTLGRTPLSSGTCAVSSRPPRHSDPAAMSVLVVLAKLSAFTVSRHRRSKSSKLHCWLTTLGDYRMLFSRVLYVAANDEHLLQFIM